MAGAEDRMYRVLVTGGAGFVGSHVVERLLSEGHRVWALDNFEPPSREGRKRQNVAEIGVHPRCKWVEGDVRDEVLLDGLFQSVPFDAVIHLAARSPARASLGNTLDCFDTNLTGTLRLLEAMRNHHMSRLVMGSTGDVYSERHDGRTTSELPASPFGASKRSAELACHAWHRLGGLSVHVLRFFELYGPRQPFDCEIETVRRLVLGGRRVPNGRKDDPWGPRDYIFAPDAAAAVTASVRRLVELGATASEFRVYDIGSGTGVGREEMVAAVGQSTGRRSRTRAADGRVLDFGARIANPGPARDELGFEVRTSLSEGLVALESWHESSRADSTEPALVH